MRVGVGRRLGGFHQGGAQIAPASLGDAARAVQLPTVMDARAEPGITDQVSGTLKPSDLANGGQHR